MFEVEKFVGALQLPKSPEYMIRHTESKRIMGFGSLEECAVMCTALNNRYYPKEIFNNGLKNLLRNED